MIFEELFLHNFGVYCGEHRVALTVPSHRPIVLFGALNGAGKTTFMEAMQLALYGKGAKPTRGRLPYADYLARSINRYVPVTEGAGLQFAFRHRTNGREEAIRLIRTWCRSGKGIKESFEVWRSDVFDPVATERWTEFVEDFIPRQISDLFFFDGEKIEALADPEQSASLLRVGLHSLLGLDLIDHLVRSLGVVERRRRTTRLSPPDQDSLDVLDREIVLIEQRLSDVNQHIASLNNQIDVCLKKIRTLDKTLEASGGRLFEQRKRLEQEYRELRDQQAQVAGQIMEIVAGDAPLLLVADLLEELQHAQLEQIGCSLTADMHEFIQRRDRQLLDRLLNLDVSPQIVSTICKFLDQTRTYGSSENSGSPPLVLPPAKQIAAPELARLVENLEPRLVEFDTLVGRLDSCERNLAAVPDEEAVKSEMQALERARQERVRLAARKEVLDEEQRNIILTLDRKKTQLQAKMDSLAEQVLAEKTTQRMVKHSVRARNTLGKYREEVAKNHMLRLEHLITEAFNQLHRKKRLGHSVSIDRDTYDIRLMERGGKMISAVELSAGERQLLAVSILWALAQASGRKLPTIIDTPLGRLDSRHRNLLVQNYFPRASHQVILFSTDEEITTRYYRALSGSIGLEYSIIFDEAKQSSVILAGYFSKEELAA